MIIDTAEKIGLDSGEICDFYQKNWNKPVILSDRKFYNWQFIGGPQSKANDCLVAYDERKKIIAGVMGLNARTFILGGESLKGAELTTWIVSEEYRTSGCGAKMLMKLMQDYEVLFGMGISEDALKVYLRMGFKFLREIPRFLKIINLDRISKYLEISQLGLKLMKMTNVQKEIEAEEFNDLEELSEIADMFSSGLNHFSRNKSFLKWRYFDHPYFSYKCIRFSSGSKSCVIVYRIDFPDSEFRIAHLTDILGDDEIFSQAIYKFCNLLETMEIDIVDFYCTSSRVYSHFLYNNWFSIKDESFVRFPHLFSPIEMVEPLSTSLIYWARDGLRELADMGKLYVTKQDCDLDRPTLRDE